MTLAEVSLTLTGVNDLTRSMTDLDRGVWPVVCLILIKMYLIVRCKWPWQGCDWLKQRCNWPCQRCNWPSPAATDLDRRAFDLERNVTDLDIAVAVQAGSYMPAKWAGQAQAGNCSWTHYMLEFLPLHTLAPTGWQAAPSVRHTSCKIQAWTIHQQRYSKHEPYTSSNI